MKNNITKYWPVIPLIAFLGVIFCILSSGNKEMSDDLISDQGKSHQWDYEPRKKQLVCISWHSKHA